MTRKTRKAKKYKGGAPPVWANRDVIEQRTIAGSVRASGVLAGDIRNELEKIGSQTEVGETLNIFSSFIRNLIVETFNYWNRCKRLKGQSNSPNSLQSNLKPYLNNNQELIQIFNYIDLNNLPPLLDDYLALKFKNKKVNSGSCRESGQIIDWEVWPPKATKEYWARKYTVDTSRLTKLSPRSQRNKWISRQVNDILLPGRSSTLPSIEKGNSREIFYLLKLLFDTDCPEKNSKAELTDIDDIQKFSVPNIFWTIIWWRTISQLPDNYGNKRFTVPQWIEHKKDCKNALKKCNINLEEIDNRINFIVTTYGAENILQIIKIPDGNYNDSPFLGIGEIKAPGGPGQIRLEIITGNFNDKINLCHMGRPFVAPHFGLNEYTIKPFYRVKPEGDNFILKAGNIDYSPLSKNEGEREEQLRLDKIINTKEYYIGRVMKLRELYKKAQKKEGKYSPEEIIDIFNSKREGSLIGDQTYEFPKFSFIMDGIFIDKKENKWYSCLEACICVGQTKVPECFKGSCLNTGNVLIQNPNILIPKPFAKDVKFPELSKREMIFLYPDLDPNLSKEELAKIVRDRKVPWEIGQWSIMINPQSVSFKIAQQNFKFMTTGISGHARLSLDVFSLFNNFKEYKTRRYLTAALITSLIQPLHHTINEIMNSVEYQGIYYDPSLSIKEIINDLVETEDDPDFSKLFRKIPYQLVIPYDSKNPVSEEESMLKKLFPDWSGLGDEISQLTDAAESYAESLALPKPNIPQKSSPILSQTSTLLQSPMKGISREGLRRRNTTRTRGQSKKGGKRKTRKL